MIKLANEKIRKMKENIVKVGQPAIDIENKELEKIKREMVDEMAARQMVLTKQQMLCLPLGVGLSSLAFERQRTIFLPTFDRGKTLDYVNETDNIRSMQKIENLMFGPLIGHNSDSIGVA